MGNALIVDDSHVKDVFDAGGSRCMESPKSLDHFMITVFKRRNHSDILKYVMCDEKLKRYFISYLDKLSKKDSSYKDSCKLEDLFQIDYKMVENNPILKQSMIDALYTFSRSKYFICWRAEEAALVCAELAHFNAENQEFSRVTRYGYSVENLSHSDFALLLRSMEVEEVNHLLSKDSRGSHLLHFLSALENLPVSFSMSTARSDRRSFPLIYVNKEFEKLTGYKRMEVVGRNCKFLQDDVNNNAKDLNKLSRHLRRRKEITIILKNKRKDGTIFDNLVVIKPIYNEMGACDYVIAMQLDVTEERCTLPLPPYKYINQRLACMIPDHLEF